MSEFNNKSIKIFQINADGNIELIEGVDPMSALIELSKIFVMQQVRIKRLGEAGVELRECASWVGHSCCQYADQILRAKAAIEAWDKESKP